MSSKMENKDVLLYIYIYILYTCSSFFLEKEKKNEEMFNEAGWLRIGL